MKKILVPLTFASIMAAAGGAYADVSSGYITGLNTATQRVTLNDGNTYDFSQVGSQAGLDNFKTGDWVNVQYSNVGTGHDGTVISPAVPGEQAIGKIATIDTATGYVTLQNGMTYDLSGIAPRLADFKAGDRVAISTVPQGSETLGVAIAPAGNASADSVTTTLAAINTDTGRVTLKDGSVVDFGTHKVADARLGDFKVGDWVTVTFVTNGTAMDGVTIAPAA